MFRLFGSLIKTGFGTLGYLLDSVLEAGISEDDFVGGYGQTTGLKKGTVKFQGQLLAIWGLEAT